MIRYAKTIIWNSIVFHKVVETVSVEKQLTDTGCGKVLIWQKLV